MYILYSPNFSKIYIGFTSNLIERFKSHNQLGKKGWTIKFRPWTVIYCEHFEIKSKAMEREAFLKSGKGREWIHKKITADYMQTGFISK
ncbi:GIY-YIG nuclease family protein [Chitinophagaceae bacterium LB-8]|uniref:GIY-YIG nuclease family protein n=2 Tax=Paraflavisolibacter caeni TaxID=2982496 RepID=A0A9X2XZG9_9BACT|nr:GIY-YIG nuclease family protein [Paraflavisolibacter caeni]MCU7551776.1 GIY-YIG nuclease family protein [Paraflavisolibacter caeni]